MHPEAWHWAVLQLKKLPAGLKGRHVLEMGSRDLNGSIRDWVAKQDIASYTGIDTAEGFGVDVVADAATFIPVHPTDLVICMEMFEHASNIPQVVANVARILAGTSGWFLMTCAMDPRRPHSGIDGGELQEGEYYGNVDPRRLRDLLHHEGLQIYESLEDGVRGDLYILAVR